MTCILNGIIITEVQLLSSTVIQHFILSATNYKIFVVVNLEYPSRPTTVFLSAASETSLLVRFSGPASDKTNPVTKFRG